MGHGHHHYNTTTEAPPDENALELGDLVAVSMIAGLCLIYACGRLAFAYMVRRMAPQIKIDPEAPPPAYEPMLVDEKKETA
jgi:hypothetical protein